MKPIIYIKKKDVSRSLYIFFSITFILTLGNLYSSNSTTGVNPERRNEFIHDIGLNPSNGINYSTSPANLTGVVVDSGVASDKGLNASIEAFVSEWEYQFSLTLPVHFVNASLPLGGLANITAAAAIFNGSLFWWNASIILENNTAPALPVVNRTAGSLDTLLSEWYNASLGRGHVMDAGCFSTMQRFTAYHAIILFQQEVWNGTTFHEMRMQIQFTNIGWMQGLGSVESFFKVAMTRQVNCVEIDKSPLNEMANITLPGYDNQWTAQKIAERDVHLAWLQGVTHLANEYHIRIFLATDELIMTDPMYDWLNDELGYSGSDYGAEETKFFPESIKTVATAPSSPVWTLIQGKYESVVNVINTTFNSSSMAGFGGFKFRIDDISLKNYLQEEVYKKVTFMHTVDTLGRFINITTAAAGSINAEVVQRTWIIQETENPFNNADLCKEMLDPINATNLILRTKETYNDHWLNSPANPTMGVSHHRWIIGWAVQAITPYYRSFLHDWYSENGTKYNKSGTMVGWWENPNIIGYDGLPLVGKNWRTLASHLATEDATVFNLIHHTFNESMRANESLTGYFHKVGLYDPGVIQNLTEVFNLSTEAFRQLFFMKAWSDTGKFRGDVVNGGNTLKYDPTRFNMFYETLPGYGGMPGVQYTLEEGYNGSATVSKMAKLCPDSYPGYGILNNSPGFIDSTTVTNSSNLTQVLGYFRGHIRAYAAFAEMFAEWRAWHVAYYHWLYTWDYNTFQVAENAREAIIEKHEYYQQTYTPKGWEFVYGYADYAPWYAIVGRTNEARSSLTWVLVISALVFACFLYSYNWKKRSLKETTKLVLGASNWRKSERESPFISPSRESPSQWAKWLVGTIGIPAGLSIGWILLFEGVFAWQFPLFAMPFIMIIVGMGVGARAGAVIGQLISKENKKMKLKSIHATGLSMFWQWINLTLMGLVFIVGGSFNVLLAFISPGLIALLVALIGLVFIGSWTFMRNMKYKGKGHAAGTFFIILGFMVACVLLISLFGGGPEKVIEDFLNQLENIV